MLLHSNNMILKYKVLTIDSFNFQLYSQSRQPLTNLTAKDKVGLKATYASQYEIQRKFYMTLKLDQYSPMASYHRTWYWLYDDCYHCSLTHSKHIQFLARPLIVLFCVLSFGWHYWFQNQNSIPDEELSLCVIPHDVKKKW